MNKKSIVFSIMLFLSGIIFSQTKTTIKVSVPNKTDDVYIVGNQKALSDWTPNRVKMSRISDYERAIEVELEFPAEFKFTRGSWESEAVISSIQTGDATNQKLLKYTEKVDFNIQGWSDQLEQFSTYSKFLIKKVPSKIFTESRKIYVALPENYSEHKTYPVVYATDAQNLKNFEIIMQTLRQQAKFGVYPQSILVGIFHSDRFGDIRVGQPKAEKFKDFVFEELVPYIDNNYATSDFRAMIGHSDGAEYNHYLMMQDNNSFDAFFSISEEIGIDFDGYAKADKFLSRFKTFINTNNKALSYFIANGRYDIWHRREAGEKIDSLFSKVKSDKIDFKMNVYPGEHNDMVAMSMLDGLNFIFRNYKNFEAFEASIQNDSFNYIKLKESFISNSSQYGTEYQLTPGDYTVILDILVSRNKKMSNLNQFLEVENKNYSILSKIVIARLNYMFKEYEEALKLYHEDLDEIDKSLLWPYETGDFAYALDIYVDEYKDTAGALEYLNKCKKSIPELKLIFAYYTAKLGIENKLNNTLWQNDLNYCKDNFMPNKAFTKEDLQKLISQNS
jgi:enterochelin esterase-like enzyme